tara:strand:+ start:42103 stop:43485 length:1383 start_codon:yes stop_codon:yes gene_type:complete
MATNNNSGPVSTITASPEAKQDKLDRFIRSTPKIYKPGENSVITAFLRAFSCSDAEVQTQIDNTKAQLFVRTAEGKNLDRIANSRGVKRPVELGLDDPTFQELIPNLSFKPKQIRKAFYDTADVFWGPLFSRANLVTANSSTYDLSPGESLLVKIDDKDPQGISILVDEIAVPGAATSEEVANILNKINGATASIIVDSLTNDEFINLRTDTPGPLGAVHIQSGSMIGTGKLEFSTVKRELRDQDQRVMIYEIRPNELLIEVPAVVPALRRTLSGSHHFHADSTIEPEVAPANCIWQGSFFYDPNGVTQSYTVSGQKAKLSNSVVKGGILTSITVDDTSLIEGTSGFLVMGWGTERQESGIRFRGVPNSNTILIDPSYIFQFDHPIGDYVNVITDLAPYSPRRGGDDLAIYLTSPSGAREAVEAILKTLAAAGIILNFVVLSPTYKYLCDNPYISDDNSP